MREREQFIRNGHTHGFPEPDNSPSGIRTVTCRGCKEREGLLYDYRIALRGAAGWLKASAEMAPRDWQEFGKYNAWRDGVITAGIQAEMLLERGVGTEAAQ